MAIAYIGMFAALALSIGLLAAFMPYLMRHTECFAVTVPAKAQKNPHVIAFRKRYAGIMVGVTIAATLLSFAAGVLMTQGTLANNANITTAGIVLECAALFALVISSFALMLYYHRKVMALKRAEEWASPLQRAAAIVAEDDLPRPLPLAVDLLYIPVLLGTLVLGLALYPNMPDQIPLHVDLAGNVTEYAHKSFAVVIGFPLLIEAFMILCFLLAHWMTLRSKRPVDLASPVTSALAYGLFTRAQSAFLLVMGIILSGGIGLLFLLSSAGIIGLAQAGILIVLLCVPLIVGVVALAVAYGQNGSRVFRQMQDADMLAADDDGRWKLGVFYVNRNDASLIVPKCFGIGWTVNLARPAAWGLIGGLALLTVVLIIAVSLLV